MSKVLVVLLAEDINRGLVLDLRRASIILWPFRRKKSPENAFRTALLVLRFSQFGDMYMHMVVETPVHLTRRQKEMVGEFDERGGPSLSPESEGFFAMVNE